MPSLIATSLLAAGCLFTAVFASPAPILYSNPTPALPAASTPSGNCTTKGVHMITVRGLSEGYPNGNMQPLVASIAKAIPGSDWEPVYYSASNVFPPYPISVDQGAAQTINAIETYAKSCPNSKIALIAYSQGAQAAMSALCGESSAGYVPSLPLDPSYAKYLNSIIIMGDPSFVGNQPYNYGTATSQNGAYPRFNVAPCQVYVGKMRNYCSAGDPFCDGPGFGGNISAHHAYFTVYDTDATAYVKNHFLAK